MIRKYLIVYLGFIVSNQPLLAQGKIYAEGKITYLTAEQVYCDLGMNDGASVGDTLTVTRRTQEIGWIIVTHLAKKSSVTNSLVPIETYQLGDRVILNKTIKQNLLSKPRIVEKSDGISIKIPQKKWQQSGTLSLRMASTSFSNDRTATRGIGSLNYRVQYRGALKLKLWVYGRSHLETGNFNLYQGRVSLGDVGGKLYIQGGRVFSSSLPGLGATDGIFISTALQKNLIAGILGGFQPNPQSLSFNKNNTKVGGFIQAKRTINTVKMGGSIAVARQSVKGNTDREFLYWQVRISHTNRLALSMNQTVDFNLDQVVPQRGRFIPTSSQVLFRYRPITGVTLHSRYSGRRQVLYFESAQTLPDSLFQDELRHGWYNGIDITSGVLGSIRIGMNIRTQNSGARPSTVTFFGYQTPRGKRGRLYGFKTHYIQNEIISGLRLTLEINQSIGESVSVYGEGDMYSYGYGNKVNDYIQIRVSGGLNWKITRKLFVSLSGDYTNDRDYSILFGYAGLHIRI